MNPQHLVERLSQAVREHYSGPRPLDESPQHYPGAVTYQKASKFIPISRGNRRVYPLLPDPEGDGLYTFHVSPGRTAGYVFSVAEDQAMAHRALPPVMVVGLRDVPYSPYKQAFRLRIRQEHARQNLATRWYLAYVRKYGGIVSDTEHLEGGQRLWRSLVDSAADYGVSIHLLDTQTGEETPVGADTPTEDIWTQTPEGRARVLVLQRQGEGGGHI